MKSHFPIKGLRAMAWAVAAFISLSLASEAKAQKALHLAPAVKAPAAKGQALVETIPNDSSEAGMLREAYDLLGVADHDYKGHRARAMKEIEAGAKHLGISLHGDGKGHEAQGTSDMQLHSAQALLQQASAGLRGKGLEDIKRAYAQLNIALSVK